MAGTFLYWAINLPCGFAVLGWSNSGRPAAAALGAVVLVLIAFGGGGALLATYNASARPIGLGLMIGWALTSILTVGYCTGLNPAMYERA